MAKVRQVRIQGSGMNWYDVRVTDTETGEDIPMVKSVAFTFEAAEKTSVAHLEIYVPVVDVIVDAEITSICPHCGQPVERDRSDNDGLQHAPKTRQDAKSEG